MLVQGLEFWQVLTSVWVLTSFNQRLSFDKFWPRLECPASALSVAAAIKPWIPITSFSVCSNWTRIHLHHQSPGGRQFLGALTWLYLIYFNSIFMWTRVELKCLIFPHCAYRWTLSFRTSVELWLMFCCLNHHRHWKTLSEPVKIKSLWRVEFEWILSGNSILRLLYCHEIQSILINLCNDTDTDTDIII